MLAAADGGKAGTGGSELVVLQPTLTPVPTGTQTIEAPLQPTLLAQQLRPVANACFAQRQCLRVGVH